MFVNSILSATSSEDRAVMLGNLPSSSRLASNGHCSDESFVLEHYNTQAASGAWLYTLTQLQ